MKMKMKLKILVVAVAMCGAISASAASAASFKFTYVASFGTATGSFGGDLNADGDTIVNMTSMVVELSTNPGVTNVGNPLLPGGIWSLSGLVAAFVTVNPTPAGFFAFSYENTAFGANVAFGDPVFQSEAYDPQNATIVEISAVPVPIPTFLPLLSVVPVPASLPLLAVGLGCLGYMARRRRNAA